MEREEQARNHFTNQTAEKDEKKILSLPQTRNFDTGLTFVYAVYLST